MSRQASLVITKTPVFSNKSGAATTKQFIDREVDGGVIDVTETGVEYMAGGEMYVVPWANIRTVRIAPQPAKKGGQRP